MGTEGTRMRPGRWGRKAVHAGEDSDPHHCRGYWKGHWFSRWGQELAPGQGSGPIGKWAQECLL